MRSNLSKRRSRGPEEGHRTGATAGRGELGDLRTAHALAGCQSRRRCLLDASLPPCPPVEAALLNPPSATPKPSWRDGPETASVEHATDVLPGVTRRPSPDEACGVNRGLTGAVGPKRR